MNGWEEIAREYRRLFKKELSIWQLRLFYFGQIRPAYKDAERAQRTIELQAHRQHIAREVAPWDVVIRLAFLYIYEQVKNKKLKFRGGFAYDKLNRILYKTLWSEFRRTQHVQIDGRTKNLPTFWAWAIENKKKYDPVISDRGMRKIDRFLRESLAHMRNKMQNS